MSHRIPSLNDQKRNFSFHIPEEQKAQLKEIAQQSGLSLAAYIEAVLREAQANGDVFVVLTKKQARALK